MARTIISREPNWSGLGPQGPAPVEGGAPGSPSSETEAASPWRAVPNLRPPAQIPVGAAQPLGPAGRNFPILPGQASAVARSRLADLQGQRGIRAAMPTTFPAQATATQNPSVPPAAGPISAPMPNTQRPVSMPQQISAPAYKADVTTQSPTIAPPSVTAPAYKAGIQSQNPPTGPTNGLINQVGGRQ